MFAKAFATYNILATVSAALLLRQSGTHEAYRFRLVANVVDADISPSVQGNGVAFNPYGCFGPLNVATDVGGTPWYFNGSSSGVVLPGHWGGYETFAGMVVTPNDNKNRVEVGCNQTTPGLRFVAGDPVPHLSYEDGAWMACPGKVLGDDYSIRLSYKKAGQSTLEGCADVELWPVCADDLESEPFEGAQMVTCLSDWTWG